MRFQTAAAWAACVLVCLSMGGAQADRPWSAKPITVLEGFSTPESVGLDVANGVAFVSNIVMGEGPSPAWTDDGTGFVSRLAIDGEARVSDLKWVQSTPQKPLNSLKGILVHDGFLWIADNASMVKIAIDGKSVERIAVDGAKQMNDVATDGKAVYVSDTGTGKVYRLTDNGHEVIKAPAAVNGITFADGKMYAVSWDLHEVYELDPAGKDEPKPFGVAAHFKNLDGIVTLPDGTFIVSDFTGNKVSTISADRKTVRTLIEADTPADMALDAKTLRLFVPLFLKDKVAVYQLSQ